MEHAKKKSTVKHLTTSTIYETVWNTSMNVTQFPTVKREICLSLKKLSSQHRLVNEKLIRYYDAQDRIYGC